MWFKALARTPFESRVLSQEYFSCMDIFRKVKNNFKKTEVN